MTESEELPFKAEYAKSARASCKACKGNITKDSLRLASVTQSFTFDGKMVKWFHENCFFEKNRPKGHLEIEGFDGLRWEDQEKIKKKLGSALFDVPVAKISDFSVERASTGKATCKVCDVKITKDELRVSAMGHDDRYGTIKRWHHPKCFKDKAFDLGFFHDITKVAGFSSLSDDDKSVVKKEIGTVKKPAPPSDGSEEPKAKKAKKDTSSEDDLAKQSKSLWKVIDQLKNIPLKDVKAFVSANVKAMPSGEDKTLKCAADIILFGALKKCPECKGQLFAESDAYHCTGSVSAYTSCIFTSKEAERKAFVVPSELSEEHSFFAQLKYKPSVRVFPQVAAIKKSTVFDDPEKANGGMTEEQRAKRDAKWKSELKTMKVTVKDGGVVDPDSGLSESYHVLFTGSKGDKKRDPYSVILNYVDIARGSNSYYRLQLLESDGESKRKTYQIFRAWGRLGTTIGDNKLEEFHSKENAIDKFEEVYFDKTGNQWMKRKNFKKQPGKFCPIEVDYSDHSKDIQKQKLDGANSKLHKAVQDIIKMIANFENMKNDMAEFEIDMEKMPLGRLSRKQIDEGYKILKEASQYVDDKENHKVKILDASNRFFSVIPHDFGMRRAPLLDNHDLINSKCRMLDNLTEIEIAYNLLSASSADESKDLVDVYYEKLKCKIEPLDKESDLFADIKKYVANTHAPTHNTYTLDVQEILQLDRSGEKKKYRPFEELPNRKLLWHGSRVSNFAGILSQGLRIAPPEAPVTGYMFGKGVYFADMVSKSANYCHASPEKNEALMLLCEVALGKCHELTSADSSISKPPSATHSVHGVGRTCPDPSAAKRLESGVEIPLGAPIDNPGLKSGGKSDLLYNEYIVYDTAQIKMKYLLKVKFNFGGMLDLI